MMKWDENKIEKEKLKLREQYLNPTGKYVDFVIRTYYFIYKKCKENNADWCDGRAASDVKIMYYIYENYYGGRPDHMGANIVDEIKTKLTAMGFLQFKKVEEKWRIYILKPLDFIDGAIEDYIEKKESNQKEDVTDLAQEYFKYLTSEGIYIYKYQKKCWNYNCEKMTDVYTYLINNQLNNAFPHKVKLYDKKLNHNFKPDDSNFISNIDKGGTQLFEEIGLGAIDKLDQFLATEIPTIQRRFSQAMNTTYYMNICKYCNSVQGINFVVYHPEELMGLDAKALNKLIAFKVYPKDINFTLEDLKQLF